MRRDEHAAAEGLAVGDGHRVALEVDRVTVVQDDPEGRRLPGGQDPERRIRVDEVAADQARLVRDPIRLGVEAAGGDAEEATAVRLADVDLPRRVHRRALATDPEGSFGMPRTRARSLPRPPGMIPMVASVCARAPPMAPTRPSPLITTGISPSSAARRASLDAVLEALRAHDPIGDLTALELALHLGQELQGPPARGVRVDEQQVATIGADPVNLFAAAVRRGGGQRNTYLRPPLRSRPPRGRPCEIRARAPNQACRTASARPQLAATIAKPPGRSTRAISEKNGGMLSCATRSKDSSSKGRSAASATLNATRPPGRGRSDPGPAGPSPARCRPRGPSRGETRARSGALRRRGRFRCRGRARARAARGAARPPEARGEPPSRPWFAPPSPRRACRRSGASGADQRPARREPGHETVQEAADDETGLHGGDHRRRRE